MNEMYGRVAELFAKRIDELFASEESLEREFKSRYAQLGFDRTEHWAGIIYDVLRQCWHEGGPEVKSEPTGMDKLKVLRYAQPLLDYNLFTQALLNLQGYTGMHYMTGDAAKEAERIKEEWPKEWRLDPFAPKAKMLKQAEVATEEQKKYNEALSTLRALRIITQFTPQISFRVSPKGSTPAFADSRNISMIGAGGDKYLRTLPELGTFYVTWDFPGQLTRLVGVEDGRTVLEAEGIAYTFRSKSGGEVLNDVLFARRVMYEIFRGADVTHETCIMVPRMNSVLVVAPRHGEALRKAFARMSERWPQLRLSEGARA